MFNRFLRASTLDFSGWDFKYHHSYDVPQVRINELCKAYTKVLSQMRHSYLISVITFQCVGARQCCMGDGCFQWEWAYFRDLLADTSWPVKTLLVTFVNTTDNVSKIS
jgi:hypothetical protein